MFSAFILFLISIVTIPFGFFGTWQLFLGLRLLLAGSGLFLAVRSLQPLEREFLRRAIRYPSLYCFMVAFWIVLQMLPLGVFPHPFWESAAAALHRPLSGAISIDIGATLLAFTSVCLLTTLTLLVAILALDRTRAEWILINITIVAGLSLTLIFFCRELGVFDFTQYQNIGEGSLTLASLVVILAITTGNFIFERFETRRLQQKAPILKLLIFESATALLLFAATFVLLQAQDPHILFIAMTAGGLLLVLIMLRRLGLGKITSAAIGIIALSACILLASTAHLRSNSVLTAFSSAPDRIVEFTQRIMSDAPFDGTGAGTFEKISQLYKSFEDLSAPAATASALLTIELGAFAFWLMTAVSLILVIRLVRGSLLRGRDSFYPAAGAACIYVFCLDSFVNVGALNPLNWIIASAILGLALAQSESRTV